MPVFVSRPCELALLLAAALNAGAAAAQPKVKPDGQWRATVGLAASYASGNTDSSSVALTAEAVRATSADKIAAFARGLYGRTDGETTADRLGFGGRYDFNLSARAYAFGQAEFLRDKQANLRSRLSGAGGVGYKFLDSEKNKFDVYAGLGYTQESYFDPTVVADELRSSYGHAEAIIGEGSNHQLTDTTRFRQRLAYYPNLSEGGDFRAEFDAGIATAINSSLDLTVGVNYRYNSDPGTGLKKDDVLFLAGVAYKLE